MKSPLSKPVRRSSVQFSSYRERTILGLAHEMGYEILSEEFSVFRTGFDVTFVAVV